MAITRYRLLILFIGLLKRNLSLRLYPYGNDCTVRYIDVDIYRAVDRVNRHIGRFDCYIPSILKRWSLHGD